MTEPSAPEETIRLVSPYPEPWRQRRGWRRMLALIKGPVLAWIAAAVILGGFALLGVIGGSGGAMSQSQVQLPAMVPEPVTVPSGAAAPSPARARHRPHRTAATATRAPRQPGSPSPATPAPTPASPHPSASPHRAVPAVQVRYIFDGTSGGGFQGEVDVVNNGRRPLADWQIVVALEGDEVTAIQNASGFDSNGILLMQPASSTEVVPPDGGTLRVFFAAQGPRTTPLACAFNQVNCQLSCCGASADGGEHAQRAGDGEAGAGAGPAGTAAAGRECDHGRMTAWRDVEQAVPEFAARVRALFDAHRHKTIATVRADGSPRISGIETIFEDGELVFGSMPDARKGADLRRNPRFALHSATVDPVEGAEAEWPGEAKISGRAIAAGPITDGPDGDRFQADIAEVVHTHLDEKATLLVIEWWTPAHGLRKVERE